MSKKNYIRRVLQLLVIYCVVVLFGCKTFTPVAVSDRNPIGSADAVSVDSITVTMEIMGENEVNYTFDSQFRPEHNIAVSRLCVANKSKNSVTFGVANIPQYLSPEDAHKASRETPGTSIAVGLGAGLITPILLAVLDTAGNSSRYLSARGFTISLAIGGIYGLGGTILKASENSDRWKHIRAQSTEKYTIRADNISCMAVFFDKNVTPLIPYLVGTGYSLSDSVGISLKKGTEPIMYFENDATGRGVVFPMIFK